MVMRKEIPDADALLEMIVRNIHHHGICRHFREKFRSSEGP